MRNKEVKLVVEKFKYHYKAITNDESFRLNMTENRLTMTLNFIKEMKNFTNSPLLGEDYVKSFMEFQFNYWFEHEGKYGRGTSVQLEWIIGKKALKRWFERSEKFKRATNKIVRKNLKKKVKFKLDGVRNEGWGKTMLELREVDEFEKGMFFNTAKGFVNCTLNTTLYHHKSKFCMECKYKDKCKEQLKEQFPIVSKLRGYTNE
jgi:hypothetical protein